MKKVKGIPKKNFKSRMIDFWMTEGRFHSRQEALNHYGGTKFDKLCTRCDGSFILTFIVDTDETFFEDIDNHYIIPVTAIDIYEE